MYMHVYELTMHVHVNVRYTVSSIVSAPSALTKNFGMPNIFLMLFSYVYVNE